MAKKIEFTEHVEIGGETVSELEYREPKMRDIRIASNEANPAVDPITYEMVLIGNLVSLTLDEMDALSPNVYKKIKEELSPFLS